MTRKNSYDYDESAGVQNTVVYVDCYGHLIVVSLVASGSKGSLHGTRKCTI